MKILAFDTSNQPLTVGVVEDKTVLSEQTINIKKNHSIQLMPAIDATLEQANLSLDSIDRIAVAAGPGSYTGLRIAVSIAKSLAWAKKIELVGVSSLKVIAANSLSNPGELIIPLFDARRKNIYTGIYTYNDEGNLEVVEEDRHIASEQWVDYVLAKYPTQQIEIIGADAKMFFPIFEEKLKERVHLARPEQNLPRASILAFLAQDEKTTEPHTFTPTYLKLAEAEENWLKEHPDFKGGDLIEKV